MTCICSLMYLCVLEFEHQESWKKKKSSEIVICFIISWM